MLTGYIWRCVHHSDMVKIIFMRKKKKKASMWILFTGKEPWNWEYILKKKDLYLLSFAIAISSEYFKK